MTRMEWPTAIAAFLLADAAGHSRQQLGGQVGVAASGRGPGALGTDIGQPAVALGGLARATLAPVRLLPGQRPAQLARCPAVGNTVMSTPHVGADDLGGALADPVMVSSRSRAAANGAITSSLRPSRAAMAPSRCPWWARASPTSSP
jgi:hypothetical protein